MPWNNPLSAIASRRSSWWGKYASWSVICFQVELGDFSEMKENGLSIRGRARGVLLRRMRQREEQFDATNALA
jgi:hypothetical protein